MESKSRQSSGELDGNFLWLGRVGMEQRGICSAFFSRLRHELPSYATTSRIWYRRAPRIPLAATQSSCDTLPEPRGSDGRSARERRRETGLPDYWYLGRIMARPAFASSLRSTVRHVPASATLLPFYLWQSLLISMAQHETKVRGSFAATLYNEAITTSGHTLLASAPSAINRICGASILLVGTLC